MQIDISLLKARIYHSLKSIFTPGGTLPPRLLEYASCEAFGFEHVGDGNFYADGVKGAVQASIKTRTLNPHILKTKTGRNFQSHPALFLGPSQNVKQNKWTNGLEIVQRRQALNFDDIQASPEEIGAASLSGFLKNVQESFDKYQTTSSQEIIGIHGYDHTGEFYLVSLFWKEYTHIDPTTLSWKKEGSGVSGYMRDNDIDYKIVERINGNSKREATCFKEYKNLLKYENSVKIKVPIPESWPFDKSSILTEINLKEQNFVNHLFA